MELAMKLADACLTHNPSSIKLHPNQKDFSVHTNGLQLNALNKCNSIAKISIIDETLDDLPVSESTIDRYTHSSRLLHVTRKTATLTAFIGEKAALGCSKGEIVALTGFYWKKMELTLSNRKNIGVLGLT